MHGLDHSQYMDVLKSSVNTHIASGLSETESVIKAVVALLDSHVIRKVRFEDQLREQNLALALKQTVEPEAAISYEAFLGPVNRIDEESFTTTTEPTEFWRDDARTELFHILCAAGASYEGFRAALPPIMRQYCDRIIGQDPVASASAPPVARAATSAAAGGRPQQSELRAAAAADLEKDYPPAIADQIKLLKDKLNDMNYDGTISSIESAVRTNSNASDYLRSHPASVNEMQHIEAVRRALEKNVKPGIFIFRSASPHLEISQRMVNATKANPYAAIYTKFFLQPLLALTKTAFDPKSDFVKILQAAAVIFPAFKKELLSDEVQYPVIFSEFVRRSGAVVSASATPAASAGTGGTVSSATALAFTPIEMLSVAATAPGAGGGVGRDIADD
ncbi:MAG: hypothetical protein COU33_00705 [Candidatus Magasanikbacteria bacterium CG10_big_fil_rev_8_21_14_0_10_43_6]|uniref:Uncharacterized protein n=1 Tax=Candidatus Magasanikbacteria bacterium CG10_big_fil_rev_8_21_14_0_10_43_6 TaxID=1974650 RepID=A0A2M6W275_9BACT|nr:MAG: hypothetical protein COU33_00705 [Candidatus Magasanikbacteria bacterium CG10_big_fil_rev_8_21_14_0_10_43_6]